MPAPPKGELLRWKPTDTSKLALRESWQTLELTYHPDFAAGRSVTFTVHRSTDKAVLGMVPASPAEVGSVVDL